MHDHANSSSKLYGRMRPSKEFRLSALQGAARKTGARMRGAALSYQQPLHNLRMVTPRAESSPSNCSTPGEVSRSPGTMTAHSRFSRNSSDLICHCPKDGDFSSPIWTMDQCRTSASAAASPGNGPDSMKWLFPCTRIPTIRSQASRRGSATG